MSVDNQLQFNTEKIFGEKLIMILNIYGRLGLMLPPNLQYDTHVPPYVVPEQNLTALSRVNSKTALVLTQAVTIS